MPMLKRLRSIADAAGNDSKHWITPEHIDELQSLAAGLTSVIGPTAARRCADDELELLWEAICDLWVRYWHALPAKAEPSCIWSNLVSTTKVIMHE